MKTFLKIVLLFIVVIIALKLLPFAIGVSWLFITGAAGVVAAVLALAAVACGFALVLALILSPLWIPLLALLGVAGLFRRAGPSPQTVVT